MERVTMQVSYIGGCVRRAEEPFHGPESFPQALVDFVDPKHWFIHRPLDRPSDLSTWAKWPTHALSTKTT